MFTTNLSAQQTNLYLYIGLVLDSGLFSEKLIDFYRSLKLRNRSITVGSGFTAASAAKVWQAAFS
jgi:hypothetical protein